jgi:predicted Zn-dependent protease
MAVEGGLLSSEGLGTATKCPAEEGCVLTEVSYRRVSTFSENAEEPVAVVLACVMAHEIGHLMGMDHSASGIMKAHFDRHDLQDASAGRFRFSAEDARRLRTAVALWTGATAPTVVAEAR